jgi:two-component system, NtrC family, nitrogen regulation sensor histidine kinase NtrY
MMALWRPGLRARAILGPLVLALVPIVVSAFFIGEIARVAQSVAQGEVKRLEEPLARADRAYREAIALRKEAFRRAAAQALQSPVWRDVCLTNAPADVVAAELRALAAAEPDLVHAAFFVGGREHAVVERTPTAASSRTLPVRARLAETDACELDLVFATSAALLEDHQRLGEVFKELRDRAKIKRGLPQGYTLAFLVIVGLFVTATAVVAAWIARRTANRIEGLVGAFRRVGEGDLEARAPEGGAAPELRLLARAFDQMVVDLRRSRAEIEYLQRLGAWQEVARRLAHEIKNPLTPIQLAVQQLHSKYDGADPRFKKILDDAHAIVSEEIAGLRRLVDAFRGFAKLPAVDARALDLQVIVDDVARGGEVGVAVETTPPDEPVTIQGDRLLLRRVLLNLLENAQQAGARQVALSWHRDGELARLFVDDDGPGVPEKQRERIFDPYFTTKEHGTGLGLAIVKKTLLEHRGDVTLSPAPSPLGGARFEISVPVAAPVAGTSPEGAASGEGSDPSSPASAS